MAVSFAKQVTGSDVFLDELWIKTIANLSRQNRLRL